MTFMVYVDMYMVNDVENDIFSVTFYKYKSPRHDSKHKHEASMNLIG